MTILQSERPREEETSSINRSRHIFQLFGGTVGDDDVSPDSP